MHHFIRVYIVCQDKKTMFKIDMHQNLQILTFDSLIWKMHHLKFIVTNQTEESTFSKRVKMNKKYTLWSKSYVTQAEFNLS